MNGTDPFSKATPAKNPQNDVCIQMAGLGDPHRLVNASDTNAFRASIAAVAFIPSGALPHVFGIFQDDHCKKQPEWLSEVWDDGRYRMMHGVQLAWESSNIGVVVKDLKPI